MAVVREFSRTTTTSSTSTVILNQGQLFSAPKGVKRCASARSQCPFRPATPRPRANPVPSPTLSGRSIVAAIAAEARRSTAGVHGVAAMAAAAATNLSAARRGVPTEVRLCSARAHMLCMYMHLAAYHP